MHVSEHSCSMVSSLNRLAPAELPHAGFSIRMGLDPFAFLNHCSLQQLKSGAGDSCQKTEVTRPATPPCGHGDEHVYHRACHSREPKAGTDNTAVCPVLGSTLPPARAALVLYSKDYWQGCKACSLEGQTLGRRGRQSTEPIKNAFWDLFALPEDLYLRF